MKYWVFNVGLRDDPPKVDWLSRKNWHHHVDESWFSKTKPPVAVSARDRAVVYGSQRRGFIAAVEVLSDDPQQNDDDRFPWKLQHRLLVSKAADENVAYPEDAGINPNRIVRGPHTEITQAEYVRAVEVLLRAAVRTASA